MPEDINVGSGIVDTTQTEAAQPATSTVESSAETVAEPVGSEGVAPAEETVTEGEATQTPESGNNEPADSDVFVLQDYKAPSELDIDDDALAGALEVIKDIDFTKKSGVDEFLKRVLTNARQRQKEAIEAEKVATDKFYADLTETLKKVPDFGVNEDNNITLGRKLVEEMGGKEALDFASTARLFETPVMAKLFARLAKERQDAKLVRGTPSAPSKPVTGTTSRGIPAFDVSNSLGSNK